MSLPQALASAFEKGPGEVVALARERGCLREAVEWTLLDSQLALMEQLTVCGWLICGEDPDTFFEAHPIPQKERVCGVVWRPGSFAYRCLDCECDSTCAICVECFKAGDHRGHNYRLIRTDGGCCDCGNAHAWRKSGFCSKHREDEPGDAPAPQLPAQVEAGARLVVRALARKLHRELPHALAAAADAQRGRAAFGPPAGAPAAAESAGKLHRAVRRGKLADVRAQLAAGAAVDALDRSEFRTTALHWAAIHGNARIVQELLDHGAAVDSINAFGQTPLLCTVFEGHLQVARLLLHQQASPLARDHVFGPPLDVVLSERPPHHRKMRRLLVAYAPGGSRYAGPPPAAGSAARPPLPALSLESQSLCSLELCRVLLRWLCAMGAHGHAVKQLLADELCDAWADAPDGAARAGAPPPPPQVGCSLLQLIELHVGCARTAKVEPFAELEQLAFMCAPAPCGRARSSVAAAGARARVSVAHALRARDLLPPSPPSLAAASPRCARSARSRAQAAGGAQIQRGPHLQRPPPVPPPRGRAAARRRRGRDRDRRRGRGRGGGRRRRRRAAGGAVARARALALPRAVLDPALHELEHGRRAAAS
jgi:hypothetical protein